MKSDRAATAIADLRAALTGIDRTTTADRILRAEAHTLLRGLARLPVALLVVNNHARYIDANRAATILTGYSRQELLRLSVWDLTPPAERTGGQAQWRSFLRRGELSGTYRLQTKTGGIVKASFFAAANVLPGLHVSALTTPSLVMRLRRMRAARVGRARVVRKA
jgi:PAS domain S-box-containing protein